MYDTENYKMIIDYIDAKIAIDQQLSEMCRKSGRDSRRIRLRHTSDHAWWQDRDDHWIHISLSWSGAKTI